MAKTTLSCPDANILIAKAGKLGRSTDMSRLRLHAANCATCRKEAPLAGLWTDPGCPDLAGLRMEYYAGRIGVEALEEHQRTCPACDFKMDRWRIIAENTPKDLPIDNPQYACLELEPE